jgi:hypothetical protein
MISIDVHLRGAEVHVAGGDVVGLRVRARGKRQRYGSQKQLDSRRHNLPPFLKNACDIAKCDLAIGRPARFVNYYTRILAMQFRRNPHRNKIRD